MGRKQRLAIAVCQDEYLQGRHHDVLLHSSLEQNAEHIVNNQKICIK